MSENAIVLQVTGLLTKANSKGLSILDGYDIRIYLANKIGN